MLGSIWPASYYMHSSVGVFTTGLKPGLMMGDLLFLACCIPILLGVSFIGLKKQER
jgi:ribosome-dependent ATPase